VTRAQTVVVADSRPIIGRLLVGPAQMVVKRGTQPMFIAQAARRLGVSRELLRYRMRKHGLR
jgi:hypothetical protein